MGEYINSKSSVDNFKELVNTKYFVDKSNIINRFNSLIGTKDKYVCITRPRRFGKTSVADMLVAYYSDGFKLKELFDRLNVSKGTDKDDEERKIEIKQYNTNLGRYSTIHFDFSRDVNEYDSFDEYLEVLYFKVNRELKRRYSSLSDEFEEKLSSNLQYIYDETDDRFVFIIDEWDYVFNNNIFTPKERTRYLDFLKNLLKDRGYVAFAYMTGVLPIAKYSSGSAINMFDEYTMFDNDLYYEYFGFGKEEVKKLCELNEDIEYDLLEVWYNGYKNVNGQRIFNPRSVVKALLNNVVKSYWTETGPMTEIIDFISNNVEDVKEDIVRMVDGESIDILLEKNSDEQEKICTREQILLAMVTYGFLTYHKGMLSIPNKELMLKFESVLRNEWKR